ncbi:MAG: glycosyltransferase family 2 protein [Kiritimatiellia bacterium]|nr:glycosyltransferase family 2 protein [Kiritimatiellia bacterium]
MSDPVSNILFLIPVYNEAANIAPLNREIRLHFPEAEICWIDDGSEDESASEIRKAGGRSLHLSCNLGIGGAMQAGYRYALDQGFSFALRIDGDGQHPPVECVHLIERIQQGDLDLVVGSRFLGDRSYTSSWHRQVGIGVLSLFLSRICRQRITDPTSGFQIANRSVMAYFAHHYPADYPEPEALALLSRQGYRFGEVPARFQARVAGRSSIGNWGTLFYAFKVFVALFVDRFRSVDPRFDRHNLEVRS